MRLLPPLLAGLLLIACDERAEPRPDPEGGGLVLRPGDTLLDHLTEAAHLQRPDTNAPP
jgi:hypothetical protein